jgi:hypothetical protein
VETEQVDCVRRSLSIGVYSGIVSTIEEVTV